MIDLHQLDGCPSHLDEGDSHAWAGAVWLDNDVLTLQRFVQIFDFERNMRDGFYQFGIWRTFPIPLPFVLPNSELEVKLLSSVSVVSSKGRLG